jgi:hypothetical protein
MNGENYGIPAFLKHIPVFPHLIPRVLRGMKFITSYHGPFLCFFINYHMISRGLFMIYHFISRYFFMNYHLVPRKQIMNFISFWIKYKYGVLYLLYSKLKLLFFAEILSPEYAIYSFSRYLLSPSM